MRCWLGDGVGDGDGGGGGDEMLKEEHSDGECIPIMLFINNPLL